LYIKIKQLEIMTTQLQSTKAINTLKVKSIRNGGYTKYKKQILDACKKHKELFGIDLTPKQLLNLYN
jgi:hypothetical protein